MPHHLIDICRSRRELLRGAVRRRCRLRAIAAIECARPDRRCWSAGRCSTSARCSGARARCRRPIAAIRAAARGARGARGLAGTACRARAARSGRRQRASTRTTAAHPARARGVATRPAGRCRELRREPRSATRAGRPARWALVPADRAALFERLGQRFDAMMRRASSERSRGTARAGRSALRTCRRCALWAIGSSGGTSTAESTLDEAVRTRSPPPAAGQAPAHLAALRAGRRVVRRIRCRSRSERIAARIAEWLQRARHHRRRGARLRRMRATPLACFEGSRSYGGSEPPEHA